MSTGQQTNRTISGDDLHAAGRGLLAGAIATVPMTATMLLVQRELPPPERWYRLPPEVIVDDLSEAAGIDDDLSHRQLQGISLASHFGYGGAMGAVYGLLSHRLSKSTIGGGVCYGLAVWGASYLGWLPFLGIRASAAKEPASRNAMMIAAHVVWGGATALLYHAQLAHARRA